MIRDGSISVIRDESCLKGTVGLGMRLQDCMKLHNHFAHIRIAYMVFVVVACCGFILFAPQAHEVHQQLGTKSAAYARLCLNMALAKQAQLEFGIEIYNDMTGALHMPTALLIVDVMSTYLASCRQIRGSQLSTC